VNHALNISVSTHWNAYRHLSGHALIAEIAGLGFNCVELGYDTSPAIVPDIMAACRSEGVAIASVHAYCPIPTGAPHGHPELFLLADPDERGRTSAVKHMLDTVRFAAEAGASRVVVHAGRLDMPHITPELIDLAAAGRLFSDSFDKLKMKLIVRREKNVARYLEALERSIAELLPTLDETGVSLGLENLPSWETLPSEAELEGLFVKFASPRLGYWHDTGHAAIRQKLGFISQRRWLERLAPRLLGMHVHSLDPASWTDHVMPPRGEFDAAMLAPFALQAGLAVLEPAPGTPPDELRAARDFLASQWRGEIPA